MSAEKIGDIKEQLKSITDSQLAQFIAQDYRGWQRVVAQQNIKLTTAA